MDLFLSLFSTGVAYASAASDANTTKILTSINKLIINPLIGFIFALAVVYFLWGVFQFFSNAENEESKTDGKSHMMWGVIGITIMLGVWTLLGIIISTLNVKGVDPENNTVNLPDYVVPTPNNLNQN